MKKNPAAEHGRVLCPQEAQSPPMSWEIHRYSSLESTNDTARELALSGCAHGTAVIADCQTAGRGRHGRSFYSPAGGGLYMSIVLDPRLLGLSDISLVTPAAAVAVCRGVRDITGTELKIKWVNDLLLDGKKVCGILTEAVANKESGEINRIVLGIGINIGTQIFPEHLGDTAGCICPENEDEALKNRLAEAIINAFVPPSPWMADADILKEYKSRLTMLGEPVTVHTPIETYRARAIDIDKLCRLIVEKEDGTTCVLSSGEITGQGAGSFAPGNDRSHNYE